MLTELLMIKEIIILNKNLRNNQKRRRLKKEKFPKVVRHVIFWIHILEEVMASSSGNNFSAYRSKVLCIKPSPDSAVMEPRALGCPFLTKNLQIGVNGNWFAKKKLYSIRCTCSPCSFSCEHQNQEALQLLQSCWLSHWLSTLMWTLSPSWIPGINII